MKELLAKHGLKVTSSRILLLEILGKSKSPKSAAQILKNVPFDRATLFRNLKSLEDAGVLSASDFGRGASYYRLKPSDRHQHHIFCVSCERVEPLDFCVIAPMIEKAHRQGFRVLGHHLELTGLCPKCA